MRYNDPLGFLITFTTYGTWLIGDERGSHDRHRTPGDKFVPPDLVLKQFHRDRMKHPPLLLDAAMRPIVREAVIADCEFRQRRLLRINVRTNHVHVVVGTFHDPDLILKNIKAWATRKLREGKLVGDRPVWSEGGSKRWLWNPDDVRNACHYVSDQQGPDLPDEPKPGVQTPG